MQVDMADIELALESDANVLISGGNATARAALARFIHGCSAPPQPLMVVFPVSGTIRPIGCTLFIEELAALDCRAQQQLMRLLDSEAVQVTDGVRATRIISGTGYNLLDGKTQPVDADLFYRLNIIHIALGDARLRPTGANPVGRTIQPMQILH